MSGSGFGALVAGLFDDAALYPPALLDMPRAVRGHARHRLSWYADMVGPFVCNAGRVPLLNAEVAKLPLEPVDVAVVVADGIWAVEAAVAGVDAAEHLRVRAVEVPLGIERLADARRVLAPVVEREIDVYVEIPVEQVRERQVHDMCASGLRLKLRTGGTTIDAFQTEEELAAPIVMCAAELLKFKCTAGLHNAVRHRDRGNGFEHHGFLNLALAARVAAATGSKAATAEVLAERDPAQVAERVRALTDSDITAIRALFASFGTCSIAEPVSDLTAMGLVAVL
jgi:hypothetical protein